MYQQGVTRIARVLRKPPNVILHRMMTEVNAQTDRFRAPRRARRLHAEALLELTGGSTLSELWDRLAARLYALPIRAVAEPDYDRACPGDGAGILRKAGAALAHRVELFGHPVDLGPEIDWHTDFKTGKSWAPIFMRDIDYMNFGSPSDVKVPWELSRLQWLMPAGQAHLLTGDERYAAGVRAVLESWIASNPYAQGVNWACTMEAAMRVLSWTWFFHVFSRSRAWADHGFRSSFLRTLYLHGEFTERYLERSDVNGNHLTADAVAMVFAGLFFGKGIAPRRWSENGWSLLCEELPRQVFSDGVDYEGSIPYHRLVLELFFLAARYREACGLPVPDAYRDRIVDMARFTLAYTRPDGSTPLLGDADDARALPFGGQALGDHRYLVGLVGAHWSVPELMDGFSGSPAEIFWTLGARAAASLSGAGGGALPIPSAAFPHGGIFVMRNDRDHVCIDCGPVGLAGRGGHGHNDCLSFEAVLDGIHLVSDCGAYVYTASVEERNRFRSTASHNTPQIDDEEINRFVGRDYLWTLHDDAAPEVRQWTPGSTRDVFVGAHTGYRRLDDRITPIRTMALDHESHILEVTDRIEGAGHHVVSIPLHLATGVDTRLNGPGQIVLTAGAREFLIEWCSTPEWVIEIGRGRISPSYGVATTACRLQWRYAGPLPVSLSLRILPKAAAGGVTPLRTERADAGMVRR